ncbi:site-specific DNA-methyltransferase [Undibacterium sp. NL8W]|uniref:Methyltransferase n=1 Tax=Undibacterium umbellatum TaxID=2762300 RepID=A0ABR6Z4Z6_9BURK|nr:site-specific DNA-methyltransferase [Undibacterium umbellatum]
MSVMILIGDTREQLKTIASESIHCVVTSPPYWGLRDYGVEGQIGLEPTPGEFIAIMVDVFEEVRRVLRADGTCWVNMGDSYATGAGAVGRSPGGGAQGERFIRRGHVNTQPNRKKLDGFKPKDLCMMPHRLAIALQESGWWVRQDIVWSKPNPMPESVRDRCTKSHEYIFLLTKSEQYFYNADAIREPATGDPEASRNRFDTKDYEVPGQKPQKRLSRCVGFGHGTDSEMRKRVRVKSISGGISSPNYKGRSDGVSRPPMTMSDREYNPLGRNKRSVWIMATHSFKDAHFATFPPELPETCIKAGCPVGGTVLDPFFGAGTTGLVADRLQRNCIGIELNPAYAEIARKRIQADSTLFAQVEVAA